MAIVKTLIVKGVARFMTDAYMSTIRSGIWNGSTIQVGYGGTGVTSAKGDLYTPVFLSSSGIAPCTVAIPHNTKNFTINGTAFAVYTTYTGSVNPTFWAPAALAGTGGYILATNAAKTGLEWVAKPTGNVTTSAVLADTATSTTQLTAAQANPFYNLLEGGAVTRSVQFAAGPGITVGTTDGSDIKITNDAPIYYIKGNTTDATAGTWTGTDSRIAAYYEGLTIMYVPQVAGASTTTLNINGLGAKTCYFTPTSKLTTHYAVGTPILLTYYADTWRRADYDSNSNTWRGIRVNNNGSDNVGTGTGTKSMNFAATGNLSITYLAAGTGSGQSGNANYFTIRVNAAANAVGVAGYVAAPTAADNKNQVWMTNASGEPAWRNLNISAAATLLASVEKTLVVDTWETMAAISSLTAGTYAIQINSGALYASGVFTACGGTDAIIDEIPLHVSSTAATWRPYARVSGANLQMTTNEQSGTARTYTIKIIKLI